MSLASQGQFLAALGIVRYIPKDLPDVMAEEIAANKAAELLRKKSLPDNRKNNRKDNQQVLAAAVNNTQSTPIKGTSTNVSNSGATTITPAPTPKVARADSSQAGRTGSNTSEDQVSFRLCFWQPSPQLIVFNALELGMRPSASQQAMLANLLKAIGHLPVPLATAEFIDWPLSPHGQNSLADAREYLSLFTEGKHQRQPFSTAILMGTMAARLWAKGETKVGSKITINPLVTGVATHSLQNMESQPELKRETWAAIRAIGDQ